MYYAASKIVGYLIPPANVLAVLTIIGVIALFTRHARIGRNILVSATAAYLLCGFGPVGAILIRPLEDRFPLPSQDMPPPAGIIVLGGALKAEMTNARGVSSLSEGGGRMTQTAILALRYPNARVVFSGTTGDLEEGALDEAHDAQRFLVSLGVSSDHILLETRARNTDENALFTRELVNPAAGEQWLLVTSAAHVPRAVGAFRHVGFDVIPYPTDYRTSGNSSDYWEFHTGPIEGLEIMDFAVHEWLGLAAYWLAGKSSSLFPEPVHEFSN